MMRTSFFYVYVMAIVLLGGCAAPKSTTVSSQGTGYSEDLSIWRPKSTAVSNPTTTNGTTEVRQTQYMEPKYAVNKQLDTVLDSIDRFNIARKFIDGFSIQVYTGSKREDALNTKKSLAISFPDLVSEVEYAQPNFRVKVGRYFNRIDAQKDYILVKKNFPTAIVIPDKVAIH
jgi:hypothetical protein